MAIPGAMQYYLDRKYDILQQQADAKTAMANASAAQNNAMTGQLKQKTDQDQYTVPFPNALRGMPGTTVDAATAAPSGSMGMQSPATINPLDMFRPMLEATQSALPSFGRPMAQPPDRIGSRFQFTPDLPLYDQKR